MQRILTALVLVAAAFASIAGADELVLRVNEVGYRKVSADNKEPEQTLLSSLEIMIRPGLSFHGRTHTGNTKMTVRGICRQTDKPDEFVLDLHLDIRFATGKFIPTETGNGKEIVNRATANTTIRVKLGQELIVGGFKTHQDDQRDDGTNHGLQSASTMKLSIVERDNDKDDES